MGARMKTGKPREHVGLVVAKWGNSLAVRLPADSAKRLGVEEGDTLLGEIAPDGRLILSAEARAIGKAESRRMREFLVRQKVASPVVALVRQAQKIPPFLVGSLVVRVLETGLVEGRVRILL